jgi:hypothetical protein
MWVCAVLVFFEFNRTAATGGGGGGRRRRRGGRTVVGDAVVGLLLFFLFLFLSVGGLKGIHEVAEVLTCRLAKERKEFLSH